MIFRLTGIVLILGSVGAVIAHRAGWALPTLDWFFSFEAKEKELASASWWEKYQANIVGYILCGVLLGAGVLDVMTQARKVHWEGPDNQPPFAKKCKTLQAQPTDASL